MIALYKEYQAFADKCLSKGIILVVTVNGVGYFVFALIYLFPEVQLQSSKLADCSIILR